MHVRLDTGQLQEWPQGYGSREKFPRGRGRGGSSGLGGAAPGRGARLQRRSVVFPPTRGSGAGPGRGLDLVSREGRNAVWLAERGWAVPGQRLFRWGRQSWLARPRSDPGARCHHPSIKERASTHISRERMRPLIKGEPERQIRQLRIGTGQPPRFRHRAVPHSRPGQIRPGFGGTRAGPPPWHQEHDQGSEGPGVGFGTSMALGFSIGRSRSGVESPSRSTLATTRGGSGGRPGRPMSGRGTTTSSAPSSDRKCQPRLRGARPRTPWPDVPGASPPRWRSGAGP